MSRSLVLAVALSCALAAALWLATPSAPLPADGFTGTAARHGLRAERHCVETQDGYLLTVFRIPRAARCRGAAPRPVLLVSGLLLSAESWLDAGPGAALGLLLPAACHDTWFGTMRGSTHGRRHRTLDPADERFWRFSADEVGAYDLPATVDYVLRATGADRLNYVGYSQGGTVALVMLAERPRYARKLGVLLAAAPPTALAHATSRLGWLFWACDRFGDALAGAGVYEVFSAASPLRRLAERLCRFGAIRDALCRGLFEAIDAPHAGSVADETYETLFRHFPAGTSVRSLARYGQARGAFQKFDFGERENLRRYGSARPPVYDLSRVSVPTVLLHGAADRLVALRDARWLAARLPRLRELHVVADRAWNHLDFLYSRHTNASVFPVVQRYLLRYGARARPRELHVVADRAWNHLDFLYSRHTNASVFPVVQRYLLRYGARARPRELHVVADRAWNHLDFLYSRHTNASVFPVVQRYLLRYGARARPRELHVVADRAWNHLDFLYSRHTNASVFPVVQRYLLRYGARARPRELHVVADRAWNHLDFLYSRHTNASVFPVVQRYLLRYGARARPRELHVVADRAWNHLDFLYSRHTNASVFPVVQRYLLRYGARARPRELHVVADRAWNHLDFLYSRHTNASVFPVVQRYLLRYGARARPRELHVVADRAWNHLDFLYSRHTNASVFPVVQRYLLRYGARARPRELHVVADRAWNHLDFLYTEKNGFSS